MNYEVLHNKWKHQTEVRHDGQVVGTYTDELAIAAIAEWWHQWLNHDRIPVPTPVIGSWLSEDTDE